MFSVDNANFDSLGTVGPNIKLRVKCQQGNRGDMQKIHVTRQHFEASGLQGHFFGKTKKNMFVCVQRYTSVLFLVWLKNPYKATYKRYI